MAIISEYSVRIGALAGVFMLPISMGCSPEAPNASSEGVFYGSQAGSSGATVDVFGGSGSGAIVITGSGGITGNNGNKAAGKTSGGVDDKCVQQDIQMTRRTPIVMFVVDRSNSTSAQYGTGTDTGAIPTRWQALHDAIMDPANGVIAKTQKEIYIGITLYDGGDLIACMQDPKSEGCVAAGGCPRFITISPEKNNYDKIAAQYNEINAGPGGTTPTAAALAEGYAQIEKQTAAVLDKSANLTPVVILVTDGEPNNCGLPIPDYQGPIDQVTAAAKKDIKTFVVGIDTAGGSSPAEVQPNLDKLAKLGNTGVDKAFTPTNKDELSNTLVNLVGSASCEINLNGKIAAGWESKGTVTLSSLALEYNGADGYKVTGESTIALQGEACKKFTQNPTVILHAEFPCAGFVLE
jgi:hypothetical protein